MNSIALYALRSKVRYAPCLPAVGTALCALRYFEVTMLAIAPIEDLRAAQKPLRYALCALLYALGRWRRIGWKNICKLWLEERTPEQLKGEGG